MEKKMVKSQTKSNKNIFVLKIKIVIF